MYSTHNDGKTLSAERSLRTLKNKIDKYTTSISKNMDINKLDKIVNKYNNAYHSTIKMKPVDRKSITYTIWIKTIRKKIVSLRLETMEEYQNIKTFLRKVTFQIGLKFFFFNYKS